MDSHFLRWMLSDGAGAVVVEFQPHPSRPSLRVDWVRQVSLAHEHDVCMRAGMSGADAERRAHLAGRRHRRRRGGRHVRAAPGREHARRARRGRASRSSRNSSTSGSSTSSKLDHVHLPLQHQHVPRPRLRRLAAAASRPSTPTAGSRTSRPAATPGRPSIFIALEEAWRTGRFAPGETVLLAVPESGRFSFAFAHLTVVAPPIALTSAARSSSMTTDTTSRPARRMPPPARHARRPARRGLGGARGAPRPGARAAAGSPTAP